MDFLVPVASLQWLLLLRAPILSCNDLSLSLECKYLNISYLVIWFVSLCYLHHLLQTSTTHNRELTKFGNTIRTFRIVISTFTLFKKTKIYNSDKIPSWGYTVLAVKLYSLSELKVIVLGISDETLKMKCGDGNCCSN